MGTIDIGFIKDEVTSWLYDKIGNLDSKSNELVLSSLNIYAAIAEVAAPYRSGALKGLHRIEMGHLEGDVVNDATYWAYVILGTAPHSIGSPVLINGEWRYIGLSPTGAGKMHPGTAANDYMQEAFDTGEGEIDNICNDFLEWLIT
jgi:hypothetical protein